MTAGNVTIEPIIEIVQKRALSEGGFAEREGGVFSPDCTAWAVIALQSCGCGDNMVQKARARLTACQLEDGRVILSPGYPETYWPTALAVLAWQGDRRFQAARDRAAQFLLACAGLHFEPKEDLEGHDTSLKGWPWIPGTFSWVVPTSLALLALRSAGYKDHERVQEGVRLLRDRQLSKGGWNFGSTFTFTTDLLPIPETTGHALNALSGYLSPDDVQESIVYLKEQAAGIRTPLSLAWSVLGLAAWGERPREAETWLQESFHLRKRYGGYRTDLIAQLAVAYCLAGGLPGKDINV